MKTSPLIIVFLLLSPVCFINLIQAEECNRSNGPAGTAHCIKISRYNDYQWAICRTDRYIRTKSFKRHKCADRRRIYCYYQCMVDVYDRNNGTVFSHCKCSSSAPQPTEGIKLPSWCYSPDGTSCNWYRECLNKTYPACEGGEDDYAIGFADKFCNLYKKSYKDFSQKGQRWVDAVRKCLQLKLVPLVDRTQEKTCAELKSVAFETHTPCYLNPLDDSSLSFCDLSFSDRWTVFWTIKSAFIDAFSSSLKGMGDMIAGCAGTDAEKAVKKVKEIFECNVDLPARITTWVTEMDDVQPIQLDLSIEIDDLPKRKKRSIRDDQETERSQLAGKIVDALAVRQEWQNKNVSWFAYANNKTTDDNNTMSIRFLLADRYKYEGVDNGTLFSTQPTNITEVLIKLTEDVLSGKIDLKVDGKDVNIMKLNGCLDWDCEVLAFNITSPRKIEPSSPVSSSARSSKEPTTILAFLAILVASYIPIYA
ncbi:uncharacterized protein LOC114520461 [Dendronephthya gigantea]|uniref:uncharacterized protein LOC114520461 n=1 Tax=Dendronephthya gigantea TaxID=151771 RepID=UPI001069149A|nr:uncharacterized protein LOC114520461 [Dendronephthya gigantea]